MEIRLFEIPPSRSARCRWALLEADLEFESVSAARDTPGRAELRKYHPLGKVPVALFDGKPLLESAAICTHIAELVPEKKLIAEPGSWHRALHDQWASYALTEMEAYLWSNARNTFILPEEERLPVVIGQNNETFKANAQIPESALADQEFLVENRFSVTDIIMGYTVNWARRADLLGDFPNLRRYLDRLFERPHCTLNPE